MENTFLVTDIIPKATTSNESNVTRWRICQVQVKYRTNYPIRLLISNLVNRYIKDHNLLAHFKTAIYKTIQ